MFRKVSRKNLSSLKLRPFLWEFSFVWAEFDPFFFEKTVVSFITLLLLISLKRANSIYVFESAKTLKPSMHLLGPLYFLHLLSNQLRLGPWQKKKRIPFFLLLFFCIADSAPVGCQQQHSSRNEERKNAAIIFDFRINASGIERKEKKRDFFVVQRVAGCCPWVPPFVHISSNAAYPWPYFLLLFFRSYRQSSPKPAFLFLFSTVEKKGRQLSFVHSFLSPLLGFFGAAAGLYLYAAE